MKRFQLVNSPFMTAIWIFYGISMGIALDNFAIGLTMGLGLALAFTKPGACGVRRKIVSSQEELIQSRDDRFFKSDDLPSDAFEARLEKLQLYYFANCPYCMKVRLALWWMRFRVESKNIRRNSQFQQELIAGGGLQQVPCLRIQLENHQMIWLYESREIIRYLKRCR